jgi:hypothetical protein
MVLSLSPGVSVDSLTFGVAVTPNGAAPALTAGQLTFSEAISGGLISTGETNNSISALWVSLSPPLSGTVPLGSLGFALPAAAAEAQSYAVTIAGAGAALGNTSVSLSIGPIAMASVASPCDVNAEGNTNLSDVQQIINQVLGVTAPFSDLDHDGVVTVADVQSVINAVLGLGCSTTMGNLVPRPPGG